MYLWNAPLCLMFFDIFRVVPFYWRGYVPRGVQYPALLVETVPLLRWNIEREVCYVGESHGGWCLHYWARCLSYSYANRLLEGVFKDSCFWQRNLKEEYDVSQQGQVVLCQSETKAFQNPSQQGTLSLERVKMMVKSKKALRYCTSNTK